MPIYEYRCEHCGEITPQFFFNPTPDKSVECAFCGKVAEFMISLPAFDHTGNRTGVTKKNVVDYGGSKRKGKIIKTI